MDGLVTSARDASLNLPHTVTTRLLRRVRSQRNNRVVTVLDTMTPNLRDMNVQGA